MDIQYPHIREDVGSKVLVFEPDPMTDGILLRLLGHELQVCSSMELESDSDRAAFREFLVEILSRQQPWPEQLSWSDVFGMLELDLDCDATGHVGIRVWMKTDMLRGSVAAETRLIASLGDVEQAARGLLHLLDRLPATVNEFR